MHCIKKKRRKTSVVLANSKVTIHVLGLSTLQFLRQKIEKSVDREKPFPLALRVVSLFSCLSNLAPLVTRVVICVSRTFCSTDQEKRETARSLR